MDTDATTTIQTPGPVDEIYNNIGQQRDREDFEIQQSELDQLKVALKDERFRQMLSSYVDEVRDPENQVTYQSEVRQLEQERGNIVHFVNPRGCYVLKTSVNGDKKAFINICSNPLIRKPTAEAGVEDNRRGSFLSIPYTQSPGREDFDKAGNSCLIYDVIFHPKALQLAESNPLWRSTLEQTAIDAVAKSFKVSLDKVNIRRPKLKYKGMKHAATIKYKIGEQVPDVIDPTQIGREQPPEEDGPGPGARAQTNSDASTKSKYEKSRSKQNHKNPSNNNAAEPDLAQWTRPNYKIKYRSHVDIQNFCTDAQRRDVTSNIPDQIVFTANFPLLKSAATLDVDVIDDGEGFELKSDQEALYYLKFKLPYKVHADSAKATFDKDKRQLTVTMNIKKSNPIDIALRQLSLEETEAGSSFEDMSYDDAKELSPGLQPVLEDPFEDSGERERSIIGSSVEKKTVRFSDEVKRQIYRSNSSILGQRKKNQRKSKSRRKRVNSVDSVSSVDEDEDSVGMKVRQRSFSGGSVSSLDDDDFVKYGGASY